MYKFFRLTWYNGIIYHFKNILLSFYHYIHEISFTTVILYKTSITETFCLFNFNSHAVWFVTNDVFWIKLPVNATLDHCGLEEMGRCNGVVVCKGAKFCFKNMFPQLCDIVVSNETLYFSHHPREVWRPKHVLLEDISKNVISYGNHN